ncbi:MAG: hypothetical protein KA198_07500 [Chitinophagaceae bacterium]|nr:hypothetical protein [Chitinophagaceae bacterium]
MLTPEIAEKIGTRWIEDWNNLSVSTYMEQYEDDVILISSLALRLIPESHGRLSDKKLLLEYWELVRNKFPDFKFNISAITYFENKVVVSYATKLNHTKAIAILTVSPNFKINRVEVSYV